jgi:ssDNA-binding Zn-finger/Zn-ribbon topoisomerase 1
MKYLQKPYFVLCTVYHTCKHLVEKQCFKEQGGREVTYIAVVLQK